MIAQLLALITLATTIATTIACSAACSAAYAGPAEDRVLLADPDPELLHAVESSLSPWHLSIVVETAVPRDATAARLRAASSGARFVVWRAGDQLVVFDRDRGTSDRRPARAGSFDPVTAAAAALTVKTMMRLPPPEGAAPAIVTTVPVVAPPPDQPGGVEVRLEAGIAARLPAGSDVAAGGRAVFAAMLRPSSAHGGRLGLRGDLGTSSSIDRAGFKGSWSDWAILVAASWTVTRGAWELEPWLAGGIVRGTLDGVDAATRRIERSTDATLHGGFLVRRRLGTLTAGAGVELDATPGAPTYTRISMGMGSPRLFQAASFSVVLGILVAVDLGR